jgi:pyridoxamine 5'-phosphate oxidase
MELFDLRNEYKLKTLDESDVLPNPGNQFKIWMEESMNARVNEPNAMSLATCTRDGSPSVRMVLLKSFDENGFSFFTNYESKKGIHLLENHYAALMFYWPELERQVRIEGRVEKLPAIESDRYFQFRPYGSRLGAWASRQSKLIPSRKYLEEQHEAFLAQFKDQTEIPRPPTWGGYIVKPFYYEFWQGRENRLHDRIEYVHSSTGWEIRRLAP